MSDRRLTGEQKGRSLLKTLDEAGKGPAVATLPWQALVTGVDGDRVTVRATNATTGGEQRMPYLAVSVAVGDTGVCIPLAGGGTVFAKTGLPPVVGGASGLDAEGVRDTIAAALVAGANATITVNDPGDQITLAASLPAHTHLYTELTNNGVLSPSIDNRYVLAFPASGSGLVALVLALGMLNDVTITGPATGQVVRHNGIEWVNAVLAHGDLSGAGTISHASLEATLDFLDSTLDAHVADTAEHGATGAVVGTTNTQTLTNKTLTAPAITAPTGIVKGDVGLGNADNTSDAAKPVSTAQQTALDLKSDKAWSKALRLASDVANTGTAGANTLTFAIAANEVWTVDFYMRNGCNNTGGIKWGVYVPSGATVVGVAEGMTTAVTASTTVTLAASTLTTQNFNTLSSQLGWTHVHVSVLNGVTAGNVQLRIAAAVSGQQALALAGSYLTAMRVSSP